MNSRPSNVSPRCTFNAFFVYDPRLSGGREDAEAEKRLCFYPAATSMDEQCNLIGLSEALISFTREFDQEHPCEVVRCADRTFGLLQCEEEIVVGLVLRVNTADSGSKASEECPEELDTSQDVPKQVLQAILNHFFTTFKVGKLPAIAFNETDTVSF